MDRVVRPANDLMPRNIAHAAGVLPGQDLHGRQGIPDAAGLCIDDRHVQPRRQTSGQVGAVQFVPARQAVADVGHTQDRLVSGLPDQADGLRRDQGVLLAHGGRQGQAVDPDVLPADARLFRRPGNPQGGIPSGLWLGGDASGVQRQDDEARAVLRRQGKHRGHALLPAVHGVQHRTPPAHAEGFFQGRRVGTVDDQGQGGHLLDGQHQGGQGLPLVDVRQSCVHHQEVRALPLLPDRCLGGGLPVFRVEGLLHRRTAGGVHALPYRSDSAQVQCYHVLPAAQAAQAVPGTGRDAPGPPTVQKGPQGPDMVRRGAAAAAQDGRAVLQEKGSPLSKLLRSHVVDGLAVLQAGQARVGLDHDGQMGVAEDLLQYGAQFAGTGGTVDADGVRPQTGQGHCCRCGVHAQEGASVRSEGHGDEDGEICPLLGRQQGGFGLQEVADGLDEDQVHPGGGPGVHDLSEHSVGFIEGQFSEGLQQGAQGAYVQGDVSVRAGGPAGDGDGGGDIGGGVLPQLSAAGAEGVGGENVRARRDIGGVDGLYRLWGGEVHCLRRRPRWEACLLEHGAHSAVEKMDGG